MAIPAKLPGKGYDASPASPGPAFTAPKSSTLLAAGPDFLQGKVEDLPAGNQDIAPTVLALEGVTLPRNLDGRVLSEAFRKTSKRIVKGSTRRIQAATGDFCSEVAVSYAGTSRYLDQAQRCEGGR